MSNKGKKLSVHYRGTLEDGTQFDSSYDRDEPLSFVCGAGQMISGFDKAVEDMQINEKNALFCSRMRPTVSATKHWSSRLTVRLYQGPKNYSSAIMYSFRLHRVCPFPRR